MDHRLDFSDLVELLDVPDTIPANPFGAAAPTSEAVAPDGDGTALPSQATVTTTFVRPDLTARCLAKLIDGAVAAMLYGLASAFFSNWFLGFLFGGFAASAYLLLSDGLEVGFMHRRSLGKRVMNLTVQRLDEANVDVLTSIRRNWMFAVGFFSQAFTFVAPAISALILLLAVGLIGYELYWVVTNPEGVRWGDDLAGTDVLQPVSVAQPAASDEVLLITPENGM